MNPYAPPQSSLLSGEPKGIYEPANPLPRLLAKLSDYVIAIVVANLGVKIFSLNFSTTDEIGFEIYYTCVYYLINAYPWHEYGQSWGKRVFRLRILPQERELSLSSFSPQKVSLFRIVALRSILPVVGLCLICFPYVILLRWFILLIPIAYALSNFGLEERMVHDYLANTRVLREIGSTQQAPPSQMEFLD